MRADRASSWYISLLTHMTSQAEAFMVCLTALNALEPKVDWAEVHPPFGIHPTCHHAYTVLLLQLQLREAPSFLHMREEWCLYKVRFCLGGKGPPLTKGSHADARTLKAAAYAPYNAEQEATETPTYKAEVSRMLLFLSERCKTG